VKLDPKTKTILKRWISIFLLGLCAGAIWLLAFWCRGFSFERLLGFPAWASICIVVIVATYTYFILIKAGTGSRVGAFLGLKHALAYPPLWLALIPAMLFFIGVLKCCKDAQGGLGVPDGGETLCVALIWIFWIALVLLAVGWMTFNRMREARSSGNEPTDQAAPLEALDFEQLKAWFADDNPIETAHDDYFSFWPMAQRLADRFKQEDESPSIAVIGEFGSGKSSLANLVMKNLEDSRVKVKLVKVELWPYHTPQAAVEGIIRALIDALAEEVPVVALRGVPGEYVEAMGAAEGFWHVLSKILRPTLGNPEQTLDQIQDIAEAIGWRYVLWVEDLERYAGGC
jgi:hypothetical protein